jgi:hypothetical protein
MARELINGPYPVFNEAIEKATTVLKHYGADWSLLGKSNWMNPILHSKKETEFDKVEFTLRYTPR